jgi:hypothetical protein
MTNGILFMDDLQDELETIEDGEETDKTEGDIEGALEARAEAQVKEDGADPQQGMPADDDEEAYLQSKGNRLPQIRCHFGKTPQAASRKIMLRDPVQSQ